MSVGPEGFKLFKELQEKGLDIILVAGASAELYTQGKTVTGDLDIIVSNEKRDKFEEVMKKTFNFTPRSQEVGRIWTGTYDGKELVVEVVDSHYKGKVWNNVDLEEFGMGSGKIDSVASPEDILVNYLAECKFWNSNCLRSYLLLKGWKERMDKEYLKKRAKEENVEDYLDEELLAEKAGEKS